MPSGGPFNSVEVNLRAETIFVWPMKGRATKDQNTNIIQENIQYIQNKRQLYFDHYT